MILLSLATLSPSRPAAVSLSVVIPAFNERRRLPATLSRSLGYLSEQEFTWEVVVVDDGSTDNTADWVMETHAQEAKVRVLRSERNCGKGAALAAGASASLGERLLFMDADGGTPISALPALEQTMSSTSSGVVVGQRMVAQSRPWLRRLMGFVFRRLAATCVADLEDTQCGFKLLTRAAAERTMPHLHVQRWAYDVELLYLAQQLGVGVATASVPAIDVPGSKIQWHTPAQMMLDIARISALYRLGIWSLPGDADRGMGSVGGGGADDSRRTRVGRRAARYEELARAASG
jgi:dolichyl-phosphate beta-glucosyltransferase